MIALPSGVSFCTIDDSVIFLDDRNDRYFALVGEKAGQFVELVGKLDQDSTGIAAGSECFVEDGLLIDGPQGWPVRACSGHPAQSQCEIAEATRSRPKDVVVALLCITWTLGRLRFRPFRRNIAPATAAWRRAGPYDVPTALQAFETALHLFPKRLDCLPHALSLRRFLHRLAIPCDFVIGVRKGPFAAHCWIQIGDQVIGDEIDRVRGYTPIRIVA